jgi:hypothetical protein
MMALTKKEQARYRAIMRHLARLQRNGWSKNDHPDFEILVAEAAALAIKMTQAARRDDGGR